jgi:hypothetical protein
MRSDADPACRARCAHASQKRESRAIDDVAECGRREDKGEIGPGKRGEVAGKKPMSRQNSGAIQGVKTAETSSADVLRVMLGAASCRVERQRITERGADGDERENQVLARLESGMSHGG